ncbi:predicted protein [Nematostella vectensis]|uniref:Uncharacterized protein n=1 Tax=Nematostella vectensis TaxID=45351 RepID=A7SHQ7_NEMVE|nr:predicted protein [Nematostella vectensis]|eukprot:XP_001628840.1 predicted protein [Nematostella vectensis]
MATAIVGLIFLISGLSAAALSPVVGTLCDKKGCFSESVIFGLVICGISLLLVGPSPAFNLFLPSAAGMPDDIATNGAVSGIVTAALNCGSFLGAFGGGVLNDWLSFSTAATRFYTDKEDAIELYTAERSFIMYAGSRNEKKHWLQKLRTSIAIQLRGDEATDSSDITHRKAAFTYKDGRIYCGSFVDGKAVSIWLFNFFWR